MISLAAATLLGALLLPGAPTACEQLAAAAAPAPAGSPWQGVYVLDRKASSDLDKVAEEATKSMRRRFRDQARSRVRQRLEPAECLRLSSDSATISVESERGLTWRVNRAANTAESGSARAAGRQVPATVGTDVITITGSGDRGNGRWELRRSGDGKRMEVKVHVAAERMDKPISYTLVYRATG